MGMKPRQKPGAAKTKVEGEEPKLVPRVYVARRCEECDLRAVRLLEPDKVCRPA